MLLRSPRTFFVETDLTEKLDEATIRFPRLPLEEAFDFQGDGWLFRPNGNIQWSGVSDFWNRIVLFPTSHGAGEGRISCRYRTQGPAGPDHRLSFVFHEATNPSERRRFEVTILSVGRVLLRYSETDLLGKVLVETVLEEVPISPTNGVWRIYAASIEEARVRLAIDGREVLAYELPDNLLERVRPEGSWALELARDGQSVLPSDALLRRIEVERKAKDGGPSLTTLSFRRGTGLSEAALRYLNVKYSHARKYIPPAQRYALKQIDLRIDERQTELLPALFAPAGSSYRFRVVLEPGDRLRARFGHHPSAPPRSASATFVVRLKVGEDSQVLFSETRDPGDTELKDVDLSLPVIRSGPAELELAVSAPAEGREDDSASRDSESAMGLWGAPRIMRRRAYGERRRPNVIVISADTLRRDALGAYDPLKRGHTPSLERFAASATTFTSAYSVSPWTTPSHFSLLSGRYPSHHGLNRAFGTNAEAFEEVETLPQILGRAGYVTAAIASDHSLDPKYGFDKGFDSFLDNQVRDASPLIPALDRFLDEHGEDEFFLFLHSYDPHAPLISEKQGEGKPLEVNYSNFLGSGSPTERDQALVRGLYGEAVARYDGFFGRMIALLEQHRVLASSIVVVVSDHGEEIFEHGAYMHGHALHEEVLQVPLMIKFPKGSGFPPRYENLIGLIDVMPTLLDHLGLPLPAGLDGKSMVKGLQGTSDEQRRYLLAEAVAWGPERKAVITEHYKYIVTYANDDLPWLGPRADTYDELLDTRPGARLFDLRTDPSESRNILSDQPQVAARMDALLRPLLEARSPARGAVDVDPDRVKALRELGYIQ